MPFYSESDSVELSVKEHSGKPKEYVIINLLSKIIDEHNFNFLCFVLLIKSEVDLV